MPIPAKILRSGFAHPLYDDPCQYEKTTDNDEVVAGRVLMRGTTDYQLKLNSGTGVPIAVADRQVGNKGYNTTTSKYDDTMCHDGEDCDHFAYGSFVFSGCLLDGEVGSLGGKFFATALGKLAVQTTGKIACAIGMETITPSGADKDDYPALWLGVGGGYVAP